MSCSHEMLSGEKVIFLACGNEIQNNLTHSSNDFESIYLYIYIFTSQPQT